MKGRSNKPYRSKTLHNAWRQLLDELNHIKADPACDLDPAALADVTDYLLDRIDDYRPGMASETPEKNAPDNAQFATRENRRNNHSQTGAR